MVLPLLPLITALGSVAGAGGGILSSIFGANAQDEANQMNWAINQNNWNQRNRERREGIDYAEEIRGEGKLGATDAQGTRTYYKEGEGWVTELGPRPKELEDYFYDQELPELRSKFDRDAKRGRTAEDMAGQLLAEFKRIVKEDPNQIEDLLYSISTREIGKSSRETLEPAMRAALRSGSVTAPGEISSQVAQAGMEQRRKAAQDAKLQSMDYVDDRFNKQRGDVSQLYNLFQQMAGAKLDPSMQPGAGPQAATALMNQFSQQAGAGDTMQANAIGRQGGSLQPVEPNMAQANMWGGIGSSVAGLGDRLGAMGERSQMNDMLQNYITQGGQLNLNSGGIMDLMTERVRAGSGALA